MSTRIYCSEHYSHHEPLGHNVDWIPYYLITPTLPGGKTWQNWKVAVVLTRHMVQVPADIFCSAYKGSRHIGFGFWSGFRENLVKPCFQLIENCGNRVASCETQTCLVRDKADMRWPLAVESRTVPHGTIEFIHFTSEKQSNVLALQGQLKNVQQQEG